MPIGFGSGRCSPIRPAQCGGYPMRPRFHSLQFVINCKCSYHHVNLFLWQVLMVSWKAVTAKAITAKAITAKVVLPRRDGNCHEKGNILRVLLQAFRLLLEENNNVIHQARSVRLGKNCVVENHPRSPASGGYPRPYTQLFPILATLLVNNQYIWFGTWCVRFGILWCTWFGMWYIWFGTWFISFGMWYIWFEPFSFSEM